MIVSDFVDWAEANEIELKFVIHSPEAKAQIQRFYETKDMKIYSTEKEAFQEYKHINGFSLSTEGDIIIFTIIKEDAKNRILDVVKNIFTHIFELVWKGKMKFIIDFKNLEMFEPQELKWIGKSIKKAKSMKIRVKFVVTSPITQRQFQNFISDKDLQLFLSVEEAINKFKEERELSVIEKDDEIIFEIIKQNIQSSTRDILKQIFRQIFELTKEEMKKFIIDLKDLHELGHDDLRLIIGAIRKAKSESISVKFVIRSKKIRQQLETPPETRDLEIYSSLQEALRE